MFHAALHSAAATLARDKAGAVLVLIVDGLEKLVWDEPTAAAAAALSVDDAAARLQHVLGWIPNLDPDHDHGQEQDVYEREHNGTEGLSSEWGDPAPITNIRLLLSSSDPDVVSALMQMPGVAVRGVLPLGKSDRRELCGAILVRCSAVCFLVDPNALCARGCYSPTTTNSHD
jgi:hypothetical protein